MTTPRGSTRLSLEEALGEAVAAIRLAGGGDLSPEARSRILRCARGEITDEEYIREVLASVKH